MHDWIATHDVAYETTFNGTDFDSNPTTIFNTEVPPGATSLTLADGRRAYHYGGSLVVGSQEIKYTKVTVHYNKQLIKFYGQVDGGRFTLSYAKQVTPLIAHNASAATLQSSLQALPAIGAGNVTVSGGSGTYVVNFVGRLAGASQMLEVSSSLVGNDPKRMPGISVSPVADAPTFGGAAESGLNGTFGDSPFFPLSAAKYRQLFVDGFNAPVLGSLRVSRSADRSAPMNLARTSLMGNVYIFVVPPEGASVAKVDFYLDGELFHSEVTPPYDLMGGDPETATALDTSTLSRSLHTLKAVTTTYDNRVLSENATFSIR